MRVCHVIEIAINRRRWIESIHTTHQQKDAGEHEPARQSQQSDKRQDLGGIGTGGKRQGGGQRFTSLPSETQSSELTVRDADSPFLCLLCGPSIPPNPLITQPRKDEAAFTSSYPQIQKKKVGSPQLTWRVNEARRVGAKGRGGSAARGKKRRDPRARGERQDSHSLDVCGSLSQRSGRKEGRTRGTAEPVKGWAVGAVVVLITDGGTHTLNI